MKDASNKNASNIQTTLFALLSSSKLQFVMLRMDPKTQLNQSGKLKFVMKICFHWLDGVVLVFGSSHESPNSL